MSWDSSAWGYGTFLFTSSYYSSSSSSIMAGSRRVQAPQLPVVFRCNMMCDSAGDIRGVKLGQKDGAVVIQAVLSETLTEICQVAPGDVVTHINGVAVEGCLLRVRKICAASDSIAEMRLIRRGTSAKEDDEWTRGATTRGSLDKFPVFYYEVHPRDSLSGIASLFRVSQQQIRQDNRECFCSGEKGHVFPGQWLRIRNVDVEEASSRGRGGGGPMDNKDDEHHHGLFADGRYSPSRCSGSGSSSSSSSGDEGGGGNPVRLVRRVVEVEGGDTLEHIAHRHGMSVMDLRRHNRKLFPVGEPAMLYEGMRLVVYHKAAATTAAE